VHGIRSVFLLLTEMERHISARLTGIPAGFLEQLHGTCVRYYFAMIAPIPGDLRSRGETIRRRGVETLGTIVDRSVIDRICSVFELRVAMRHASLKVTEVGGQTVSETIEFKFDDPALPVVQQVMTEQVVDALRATLSANFHVVSYTMWRNHNLPDGERNDVYSNRWHVDGARTDEYKLFVFMHDVTPDHGGTIVATRAETRMACRAGYLSRRNYAGASAVFTKLDGKSCMTGPKGYAYIFTPNLCLHRAGVPRRGLTRTVLMVIVLPSRHMKLSTRVIIT